MVVFAVMLVMKTMQDVSTKCLVALLGGSSEILLARFYFSLWWAAGL